MKNKEGKRKSSTILKDAIALFLITLISGLALSYIYELTKGPIAVRAEEDKIAAYQKVYADASSFEKDEDLMNMVAETDLTSLNPDYKGITINEVNKAFDANKKMLGYIVKVSTTQGYKDVITIAIGYTKEGVVTGMEPLALNETAGLGMNAAKPEFKDQFTNKKVEAFEVTKTGATADNQIDAISSATITSRAVTNAVNAGISFIKQYSTELGGGTNE